MAFLGALAPVAGAAGATGAAASAFALPSLWTVASSAFGIAGTLAQISSNNAMASAQIQQNMLALDASALDASRRARDSDLRMERDAGQRTALLAASGGLTDASESLYDIFYEGSLEKARAGMDLSLEAGRITTQNRNIGKGTGLSNLGAAAKGAAGLGTLLGEVFPGGSSRPGATR